MGTLYKGKNSKFWHLKITINGRRCDISTGQKTRRDAENFKKGYENRLKENDPRAAILIPKFSHALKHFLKVKQIKHKTWELYKYSAEHMLTAVTDKEIDSYNIFDYERLLDYLNKKNFSTSTKSIITRHLFAIFNYFKKEGYLKKNPIQKINIKEMPKPIGEDDLKRILAYFKELDSSYYRLVRFAVLTGFRRSTLTEPLIIDMKKEIIRAKNVKGDRDFYFPIYQELKIFLNECGINEIFVGKFTKFSATTLSHKFNAGIKKLLNDGFIEKHYNFHQLRHTAATHFADKLADIKSVKDILDHTDIRTSEGYVKINLDSVKRRLS